MMHLLRDEFSVAEHLKNFIWTDAKEAEAMIYFYFLILLGIFIPNCFISLKKNIYPKYLKININKLFNFLKKDRNKLCIYSGF